MIIFPKNKKKLHKKKIVEKELRATINNEFGGLVPKLLEIPSKDQPYDPKKVLQFIHIFDILCILGHNHEQGQQNAVRMRFPIIGFEILQKNLLKLKRKRKKL